MKSNLQSSLWQRLAFFAHHDHGNSNLELWQCANVPNGVTGKTQRIVAVWVYYWSIIREKKSIETHSTAYFINHETFFYYFSSSFYVWTIQFVIRIKFGVYFFCIWHIILTAKDNDFLVCLSVLYVWMLNILLNGYFSFQLLLLLFYSASLW